MVLLWYYSMEPPIVINEEVFMQNLPDLPDFLYDEFIKERERKDRERPQIRTPQPTREDEGEHKHNKTEEDSDRGVTIIPI